MKQYGGEQMKNIVFVAAIAVSGAAMAAGLTADSYVQDGLVTHFDAIDNEGTGTHNASATRWVDLKGSAYITVQTGATWSDRYFDSTPKQHTIAGMPAYSRNSLTMEVPINVISNGVSSSGSYPRIFANGESFSIYFEKTGTKACLYFNAQTPDTRPNFSNFRMGTVYVFSDSNRYGIGLNAAVRSATTVPVTNKIEKGAANWVLNGNSGYVHGHYYGLRFYNRSLTPFELKNNADVDGLRFFSYTYNGSGSATSWSDIAWTCPEKASGTAPSTLTNEYAQVVDATVSVDASDGVALAGLSLEDGATLNVAEDAVVVLNALYVEGAYVQPGVYTGTGSTGTQVSWLSGQGVVRVGTGDAYLQSTGIQAINTGYFVKPTTRIVADYAFTSATPTQQRVFGAAANDSTPLLSCAHYINGNGKYAWALQNGAGNWTSTEVTATTDRRTFDLDGYNSIARLLTGGAVTKSTSITTTRTQTSVWPLAIFANCMNAAGTAFNNYGSVKLYSFAIYEEGVLKHGYMPYRNADGTVVGLKDVMTGEVLEEAYGAALASGGVIGADPVWELDDYRCHAGTGATEDWGDLSWSMPFGSATAPSAEAFTQTNMCVEISNAKVNVAASDNLGLLQLSLTNGASLNLASDAIVAVRMAYVDGVAVPRGIYTGTGSSGTQVDWLDGDGMVRVGGSLDAGIPYLIPTPAADGWYEFGLASGYAHGTATGSSFSPNSTLHYITGEHPNWDDYLFPAGAKLRLVGGILLETVPAGVFSEYDMSGLKIVYLHGDTAFEDGTPLTVPSGCVFRYQSGTWKPDAVIANRWWLTAKKAWTITYAGDIVNDGQINITGDGGAVAGTQVYTGEISGSGKLHITNYGKQGRFQGPFSIEIDQLTGMQNGCLVWLDTLSTGGKFKTATLSNCDGKYATNATWSANGIFFGKNNSDATADHELKIDTLNGNAISRTDPAGKRWRVGGHVIVWGSNTVHVGELKSSLHVMARRQDQHCNNNWFGNATCKGIGNIVVDRLTSGTLFLSTNINAVVGTVVIGSTFDYTYQSGAINGMTLDITNSCNASAIVKATDIGMLPARLSGFKGTVTLTDTATKSYTMPIDFTQGTNCLYNKVGCIGSGTLGSAPENGTIDVTFPTTGEKPVRGEYALARFTSGGELLDGWNVTLNGQATDYAIVSGMKVEVKKDATGLWLDVSEPGFTIILR